MAFSLSDALSATLVPSPGPPVEPLVCQTKTPHWFCAEDCSKFTSKETCDFRRNNTVWIASYPGSGNTWLRHLLQTATGVYTGSCYRDRDLTDAGYAGETVTAPSRVLGVKTHADIIGEVSLDPTAKETALVLIRDPVWAALAFVTYGLGNHAEAIPDEALYAALTCQNFSMWREMISKWQSHTEFWFARFPEERRRFVRYEDLKDRTERTLLSEVLPFFGVDAANEDIVRAVRCELQKSTQHPTTKRVHKSTFRYPQEAIDILEEAVGPLMRRFNYTTQGIEVLETPPKSDCCAYGADCVEGS